MGGEGWHGRGGVEKGRDEGEGVNGRRGRGGRRDGGEKVVMK